MGRFTAIDPLATKFASLSGYHYAYNNPVMFNDPLGAQGEPGNPWFSGGYRWMENMSPPPAAYNSMGASTFGSTMGNYWYQAMSGNNWGEQMMHQSQLASQARGGDMGAVREYAARYGGGVMTMEVWHSTAQAGGETYYHYEVVVGGGNGQDGGIDSNYDAVRQYLFGDGSPQAIGPNTTRALMNTQTFRGVHNDILRGKRNLTGEFRVDMTDIVFHIGRTTVSWNADPSNQTITYSLYLRDGFWDPDFIDERVLGEGLGIPRYCPV